MASCTSLVSEDQLLCPICLDIFDQPISTPCGHNFCMNCLTSYWDNSSLCTCPVCKHQFTLQPDLKVNTFISGLVQQFASIQLCKKNEEAQTKCDICTEPQQEAIKSCVECMTSYCQLHLEPHLRVAGLKRHTLMQPLSNLDNRLCQQHNQPVTLFCQNEKVLLCTLCASSQHTTHKTVHLQRAAGDLKGELEGMQVRVHAKIQDGFQQVTSIQHSLQLQKDTTRHVIANSMETVNAIVSKLQNTHAEMVTKLEEKQQELDVHAEFVVNQIERKVENLKGSEAKIKEMKDIQDPLLFLQNYSTEPILPQTADFSALRPKCDFELQQMRKSLSRQLQILTEKMDKEVSMLSDNTNLRNVQKYAVNFELDPETANPRLVLSRNLKKVKFNTDVRVRHVATSKMFTCHYNVLGASGFTERFYFEIYVGEKMEWILGVSTKPVQRQSCICQVPGCGVWALYCRQNTFETYCRPKVIVYRGKVERVGVYVDYDRGQILFYDVKAAILIHSFTDCVFTEKLYPILNPCDNELGSNLGSMKVASVNPQKVSLEFSD